MTLWEPVHLPNPTTILGWGLYPRTISPTTNINLQLNIHLIWNLCVLMHFSANQVAELFDNILDTAVTLFHIIILIK